MPLKPIEVHKCATPVEGMPGAMSLGILNLEYAECEMIATFARSLRVGVTTSDRDRMDYAKRAAVLNALSPKDRFTRGLITGAEFEALNGGTLVDVFEDTGATPRPAVAVVEPKEPRNRFSGLDLNEPEAK